MDDELRKGRVKHLIGKGQMLCGRLLHIDPRMARTRSRDKRFGRIDGHHRCWPHSCGKLGRECSGAATDVEYPLTDMHLGQVSELRRQQHRVPPHEAVIRIRRDDKAHDHNLGSRLLPGQRWYPLI